jgi:glycosyltransferase involved in cell wall biosynthesis
VKLALLAPAWYPVPPPRYGGIERVVSILADGLVEAGHEVTLFASRGSRTKAELAGVLPSAPAKVIGDAWIELAHALACYERAAEFDLINDHSGPIAAALGATVTTPGVHTVHGPLSGGRGPLCVARSRRSAGGIRLGLAQPARAARRPSLGRELSSRARSRRLSRAPRSRRLPPLPRAYASGQGLPPRGRGREGGRRAR